MKSQVTSNNDHFNRNQKTLTMRLDDSNSLFEIAPNQGGRIVKLIIDNQEIITEPSSISYSDSYAAALLCPFPNRVEDGVYNFDNKVYQLNCNQVKEHNALHGLIYNQTFEIVNQFQNHEKLVLDLKYISDGSDEGFPFKYEVYVSYQLKSQSFKCEIKVANIDAHPFPFALGWHPYFLTSEKDESTLQFEAKNQLINNYRNIPIDVKPRSEAVILKYDQSYDDCFELSNKTVHFRTPEYHLTLELESASNYLQIYTPKNENVIAIEPMTAPANSFNNGLGLQILEAGASHTESWVLNIVKPTLN